MSPCSRLTDVVKSLEFPTHFSGFRAPQDAAVFLGTFLWIGDATFRSDRVQRIFYEVNVVVEVDTNDTMVRERASQSHDEVTRIQRLGYQGFLWNWQRRRCRPIKSVTWHHWLKAPAPQYVGRALRRLGEKG